MLKYTVLVEQIESLMDDPAAAPLERITELANQYVQAAQWVNNQSFLCVNTLRDGNPSEALRLCRKLDLLENYHSLLFDDYDAWVSSALTFGDVAIPPFNKRLIDELEAAEVCMKPIEEVLKSHRILALTRAPLSARIPVLRKLVSLDSRNAGWKKELKEYESARLEQIYEELLQNDSPEKYIKIAKEIDESKWSVAIPIKIKKRIEIIKKDAQKKTRGKQVDQLNAKLQDISENLIQAYNLYDFESAKRWKESWLDALSEFQSIQASPSFDMLHSVDDVLDWIDSEQQSRDLLKEYNAQVAAADRELKRQISIDKCQKLLLGLSRSADAVGQTVPERFYRHLDRLIENEKRKKSQRNRFITGITAVVLLCVIGVLGFGAWQAFRWYQFNYLLDALAQYQMKVSQDRNVLHEACQFVQNLESSGYQLALYPEVQKNIAYIKKLSEEDKVRHEDWKLLYDKIDRSLKDGIPASADEMSELEKLSILNEEKEAYAAINKSNAEIQKDSSSAFVKNQNEKLDKLEQTVNEFLKSDDNGNAVKLRELETQALELKQTFSDYAFGKQELQKDAQNYESKCNALLASIQGAIKKINMDSSLSDDLEKLSSNLKTAGEYVRALETIIEKNANSSYAADFKAVVQSKDQWGQTYLWNDFIEENSAIISGSDRKVNSLKQFIEHWNNLKFKPKSLSSFKKINGRIPYYQSIADCNWSKSLVPLKDLCYFYNKSEIWFHDDTKGVRYFFRKKPNLEIERRFAYMTSFKEDSTDRISLEPSSEVQPLNNQTLCRKVNNLISMINDNHKFSPCGIRILDVIYEDTSVKDPIVKYQFLMTALDCFTKSDRIINESFESIIQNFRNERLMSSVPFNTETSSADRVEATRYLERLKGFMDTIKAAQKRNEQLEAPFSVETLHPVGWLDKTGSKWEVKGLTQKATGNLYIVGSSDITLIGSVDSSNRVQLKAISNGKRGMPVFTIKEKSTSKKVSL